MSPEYAMQGLFSIKSDVYSFGVLLLEIICGRKNSSYIQDNTVTLIGHVWDLWREERALDIVDSSLENSYDVNKILRCIHVGLLCVQECAPDRPIMSEVAFMLCNETRLPYPKQPAFIFNTASTTPYSKSASAENRSKKKDEGIKIRSASATHRDAKKRQRKEQPKFFLSKVILHKEEEGGGTEIRSANAAHRTRRRGREKSSQSGKMVPTEATDIILAKAKICNHVFKNGQTLVCANQRFELEFFNVSSTNNHNHGMWYLGIWYREIKLLTAVWDGNMMKPLRGIGMRLVLNSVGDLLLRDDMRTVIWFVGLYSLLPGRNWCSWIQAILLLKMAWAPMVTVNKDICDRYISCGPYGIFYADDPGCQCLEGFVASSPNDWCGMDCGDGYRRNYALNCCNGDGFVKYKGQKLLDNFSLEEFEPSRL
ncbi:Protein kinase domain-containing protein [Forsythia ovata]|uniref:Protein kinase domain-containing protein n=1 Tax=Forsythia ovata TaxID=205694 RepID=A0ABD1S3D1_9LAMI